MTTAQQRRFYFPHWHECAVANDWFMVKGRLKAELLTQREQAAAWPEPARAEMLKVIALAFDFADGEHRAGFDVEGWDMKQSLAYPFARHIGDALDANLDGFDFVWASPPCQAHTALKTMHNARKHVDLIPETRAKLEAWGGPYIIENVPGAPLRNPVMLCGTMFGLGTSGAQLRRHRLFESNVPLVVDRKCNHHGKTIGVYGGGHGVSLHRHAKGQQCFTAAQEREAMGIDWMTVDELSEAIPPAYSEYLGRQILAWVKAANA